MKKPLYNFEFTALSLRQFKKLPLVIQKRIKEKLEFLSHQKNILAFAKTMQLSKASHRFRIGDYRVITYFEKIKKTFVIIKVGHRREVYQ